MQSSTPFSFAGALILLPLAVLTVFWPLRSVALFALVAPFGNLPIWLGWDPRVYWGAMLGIRMFYDRLLYPNQSTQLPRYAITSWLLFVSLATLGLYGSAAALPAADVADAFSIFFYFMGGSMYLFAAVWFLNRESDTTVLLTSLSSASLAVSLWAIAEAWANYGTDASTRVGATFGNANYLATNLALSSTSLLIAARYRSGRLRAFLLISAVAAFIGTCLTLSRTGIVSLLLGWALIYVTRTGRVEFRKALPLLAAIGIVAGVGVGVYLRDYRQTITFSDDPRRIDVATAQQAAEDLSRLEAALYAFQLIGEHPVLGSGFGTFPARNYDKNGVYVVTHNTILQALSGTGTLGTVFLGVLLWTLAHAMRRAGQILYLPVAGCFAVNSLFGDYLQSIDVLAILAVTYLLCWQAAHPVRPAQHTN